MQAGHGGVEAALESAIACSESSELSEVTEAAFDPVTGFCKGHCCVLAEIR